MDTRDLLHREDELCHALALPRAAPSSGVLLFLSARPYLLEGISSTLDDADGLAEAARGKNNT
jgi:hypothetical protein